MCLNLTKDIHQKVFFLKPYFVGSVVTNCLLNILFSFFNMTFFILKFNERLAQSAVEYTDPTPNECPGYDTKQSDGKVPAVLELWGMRSTPSLPSLPGPLWPGVVAPDRALSMG